MPQSRALLARRIDALGASSYLRDGTPAIRASRTNTIRQCIGNERKKLYTEIHGKGGVLRRPLPWLRLSDRDAATGRENRADEFFPRRQNGPRPEDGPGDRRSFADRGPLLDDGARAGPRPGADPGL